MTFDEIMASVNRKTRRAPSDEEHQLQVACVRWFALEYPGLRGRLFAVPNGGKRSRKTAATLKEEGVVAGVSDLVLLRTSGRHGALLVEMKTVAGRQSESQKEWEKSVTKDGEYVYRVCRSLDDFIRTVRAYLSGEEA